MARNTKLNFTKKIIEDIRYFKFPIAFFLLQKNDFLTYLKITFSKTLILWKDYKFTKLHFYQIVYLFFGEKQDPKNQTHNLFFESLYLYYEKLFLVNIVGNFVFGEKGLQKEDSTKKIEKLYFGVFEKYFLTKIELFSQTRFEFSDKLFQNYFFL